MKIQRVVLFMLCLLVFCSRLPAGLEPYDPATMNFPVLPDDAMATARTWAGDETLSFNPVRVWRHPQFPEGIQYVLDAPAGPEPGLQFCVSALWPELKEWRNRRVRRAVKASQSAGQPPVLSPAQVEQVALAFAQTRYADFDAKQMASYAVDENAVTFYTRLPNDGWYVGNVCVVSVSPYTGEAYYYLARSNDPVNVGINPTLSAAQAEARALGYYLNDDPTASPERIWRPRNRSAFTTDPTELWVIRDGLGAQRLVWAVSLAAGSEPHLTLAQWQTQGNLGATRYDVQIDAHTGEFVDDESYLGSPAGPARSNGWRSRAMYAPPAARPTKRSKGALADKAKLAPARVTVDGRVLDKLAVLPRLVDDHAAWYLGYVRGPLWKMQMRRDGARVTVTTPTGEQIAFEDGKPFLWRGGVAVPTKAAPVVIAGRTFVGLDVWEALTGGRFAWAPATRTLAVRSAPQMAVRTR